MRSATARAEVPLSPAQQRLVEVNTGLAHQVAWRYIKMGVAAFDPSHDVDDFQAVALMGLCKAARVYDPARGLKFSTIAVCYVIGELNRYVRDYRPAGIHWSRSVPFANQPAPWHLDAPIWEDGRQPKALLEEQADPGLGVDETAVIHLALAKLPEHHRMVAEMRCEGRTQEDIAQRLGVSQAQVCRLEKSAYDWLQRALSEGEIELTDKEQRIIAAMDSLPAGSPVRRIGDAVGQEVTVFDMAPLVKADLVVEVKRLEAPVRGYTLTPAGRKEAARIRQSLHPDIKTPEMAAPAPTGKPQDRVSKAQLEAAVEAGKDVAWMSLRFDVTQKGIRELLAHYGLEQKKEGAAMSGSSSGAVTGVTNVGDTSKHRPGHVAAHKGELFELFDAGKGANKDSQSELAKQFFCTQSSISYWYKIWKAEKDRDAAKNAATPDPATPQAVPEENTQGVSGGEAAAPEVDAAPALTAQEQEIVSAALETMGVGPAASGGGQPKAAGTGEDAPAQPVEQAQTGADAPVTADQLKALQEHFAGGQVTAQPAAPVVNLPAPPQRNGDPLPLPEEGRVYEGVVHRVDRDFVLINLVELHVGSRWVRGKCSRYELPDPTPRDCADRLREGDTVNVRVLSVQPPAWGSNLHRISLSVKQAPAHPEEPEALRPHPTTPVRQMAVEAAPIVARGSDVVGEVGGQGPGQAGAWVPAVNEAPALPMAAGAEGDPVVTVRHLCGRCVKSDVCRIVVEEFYSAPVELPDENKPKPIVGRPVVFSPRYVQECAAFRRE